MKPPLRPLWKEIFIGSPGGRKGTWLTCEHRATSYHPLFLWKDKWEFNESVKCALVCCTDLPDVFSPILRFYIKIEFTTKEEAFFLSDLLQALCACMCVYVCVRAHACVSPMFFCCFGPWPHKLSRVREVEHLNGKPPRRTQVLQEMVMVTELLASFPLNLGWKCPGRMRGGNKLQPQMKWRSFV